MSQPTDTTEPSPASAGSHGKPVAWLITGKWTAYQDVTINKARAYSPDRAEDVVVTPLYRQPTLTDEERGAIEHGIAALASDDVVFGGEPLNTRNVDTLRSLLNRAK
jgi:hypothetical protein